MDWRSSKKPDEPEGQDGDVPTGERPFLRMRADSAGSIRGAFYSGHLAPTSQTNAVLKQRRKKKRHSTITPKSDFPDMLDGIHQRSTSDVLPKPTPKSTFKKGGRSSHQGIPEDTLGPLEEGLRPSMGPFNSGNRSDSLRYSGEIDEDLLRRSSHLSSTSSDGKLRGEAIKPRGAAASHTTHTREPSQQEDIAMFAMLAQADYGAMANSQAVPAKEAAKGIPVSDSASSDKAPSSDEGDGIFNDLDDEEPWSWFSLLDPTPWLLADVKFNEKEEPYFDHFSETWTLAGLARHYLFNPINPEFTSMQLVNWAVIIGVVMGIFSALWKTIIEVGLDFFWETVPVFLLDIGIFDDVDGFFPIYHYMWIFPAIMGGLLAYISADLTVKIPDQNGWINNVHSRGVQDHAPFLTLFIISTAGMWSGLSLGPELPLVLTSSMFGSWLALACKQSILQARILNLTAASAAVGGFFGFPMAGALFVLEIPHRMGLQYFEALSPGVIASIVAVLSNRIIVGNDVTGYYSYPFLTATLPSAIFTHSIVYGLFGTAVGMGYIWGAKKLKMAVHDLFHPPHDEHHGQNGGDHGPSDTKSDHDEAESPGENVPLMGKVETKHEASKSLFESIRSFALPHEPTRAGVAGALAGAVCGVIGIFVPHTMFWGEAQLQNLIDKGRTPLPVFGEGDEPSAGLVALGLCMIDPNDPDSVKAGFSTGCAGLITVSKIAVVGLSLGTGIVGGHFWGPLFVGCAASHFLADVVNIFADYTGFGRDLAAYPCLIILCTMGSAHVVTFRAQMAIMLILTLTISAFDPEEGINSNLKVAGDYSAVFPLLVVSVFVALMASRNTIFYPTQRNRGDIIAVPEVLCEPGMEGRPTVIEYDVSEKPDDDEFNTGGYDSGSEFGLSVTEKGEINNATQADIELEFAEAETAARNRRLRNKSPAEVPRRPIPRPGLPRPNNDDPKPLNSDLGSTTSSRGATAGVTPAAPLTSSRLDELLGIPPDTSTLTQSVPSANLSYAARRHRRVQSMPVANPQIALAPPPTGSTFDRRKEGLQRFDGNRERTNSGSSRQVRVTSFGEIQEHQPSLTEQARLRSASSSTDSRHRRIPSLPSGRGNHSRKSSDSSVFSMSGTQGPGTLSMDDIEQSFESVLNQQQPTQAFSGNVWSGN